MSAKSATSGWKKDVFSPNRNGSYMLEKISFRKGGGGRRIWFWGNVTPTMLSNCWKMTISASNRKEANKCIYNPVFRRWRENVLVFKFYILFSSKLRIGSVLLRLKSAGNPHPSPNNEKVKIEKRWNVQIWFFFQT